MRWKAIPNWPLYEVSDTGIVRRAVHGQGTRAGRVLQQTITNRGHCYVNLYDGNNYAVLCAVHRLVLETFRGPCPVGKQGCHKNDVPADNRESNLYWGTPTQNWRDFRQNKGKHHNAAMTPAQAAVVHLRFRGIFGECRKLAEEFGVPYHSVRNLKYGTSYRYVAKK